MKISTLMGLSEALEVPLDQLLKSILSGEPLLPNRSAHT
jgi:hypothetical protein